MTSGRRQPVARRPWTFEPLGQFNELVEGLAPAIMASHPAVPPFTGFVGETAAKKAERRQLPGTLLMGAATVLVAKVFE